MPRINERPLMRESKKQPGNYVELDLTPLDDEDIDHLLLTVGVDHHQIDVLDAHKLVLKYIKILEENGQYEPLLEEVFDAVLCPITIPNG